MTAWWPFGKTVDLDAERHHEISTALPFPGRLDWSEESRTEANLDQLRAFAEEFATSVIDWYIRKRYLKRAVSRVLRFAMFTLFAVAAAVPLLLLLGPEAQDRVIATLTNGLISQGHGVIAEAALILIGIAGGLNLLDRLGGFSSGWMRYVITAMQINEALIEFRFKWNALEREAAIRRRAPPPTPPVPEEGASGNPAAASPPSDLTQERLNLAYELCRAVLKIAKDETSSWTDELNESMRRFDEYFKPMQALIRS